MKNKSPESFAAPPHVMRLVGQPPRAVRWGIHPYLGTSIVLGITEDDAVCQVIFKQRCNVDILIKEWQQRWCSTQFVADSKSTNRVWEDIERKDQGLVLQMTGTPFQHSVWKEILRIPPGKTQSYGTIARRIKNPKAQRAVGAACGLNPIPILVPCHRVIATQGGLGGFTGGLALKKKILESEGFSLP